VSGVSADRRYLVDQNGQPFLVNGDSVWDLAWALDPADQQTYLADRHANGFNAVLTDLVGSPGTMGGNQGGANWHGDLPFLGGDFTQPNPDYWSKIDTFFQEAQTNDVSVFAIPIDAYAIDSVFAGMSVTQAGDFGTFLAQRYPQSQYPGIVWMMGNDYGGGGAGGAPGGGGNQGAGDWNDHYEAMINAMRAAGDTRPVTTEFDATDSLTSDTTDSAMLAVNNTNWEYSYVPTYETALRAYASDFGPAVFGEGTYENTALGPNFPDSSLELRKQPGWTMTSGSAGGFYGNDALWQFQPGWQSLLDTTDVAQRHAMFDALAATDWWTLQPDTSSNLVTAGRNNELIGRQFGGPNTADPTYGWYVTAAYSGDGTLAVIYNPDTRLNNNITISSSMLASNPQITAVDPTNGAETNLGWTTHPTMGANAAGDHDWLFIITATATAG
jgi:hypothetical protein